MAEDFAYIRWKGDIGGRGSHEVDSYVGRVAYAWSPISTFATSLDAHTLCNKEAIIRVKIDGFAASAPGTDVNIDKRAIIYFRDPDSAEVLHFSYPAPITADLEQMPSGLRMKDSVVATIVGYVSILNSKTYVPLYGLYYQKV